MLLNGGAPEWRPPEPDDRVRVLRAPATSRGVGSAKKLACSSADGEVLVELDHDDLLSSDCLEKVAAAFEADSSASLVFSDFAQVNEDGSPNHERFNQAMGWEYDEVDVDGTTQLRCRALAGTPHNVAYIWYAPNHVRAFRREAYEQVGGYDPGLEVLDDQDLMTKLFTVGDFHHVPDCLYLQRVHGMNTQFDPATNAHIQQQTVAMYQQNIEQLGRAWAGRHGLTAATLRTATMPGSAAPGEEVVLLDADDPRLPYADDSVGVLKAHELLQRVPDRTAFFNECHRVLVHLGCC